VADATRENLFRDYYVNGKGTLFKSFEINIKIGTIVA
jgi:hypothetical protein